MRGKPGAGRRAIRIARSSNRRVLGTMNEMRFHIEVDIEDASGLDRLDLADLHQRLNRIPWSATGYRYAVAGISEYLANP